MFASRKSPTIHSRPLTRPMPSAYALSSETRVAAIATTPLIQIELTSFSGKLTRVQKLTRPSKYRCDGRLTGPLAEYSAGDLNALSTMMTNGIIIASATSSASARITHRTAPRWWRLRRRGGRPGARTTASVAMSATFLALARSLRTDEGERDEDHDEGEHGRDGRAVAHLGLGEEVLVREV